MAPKGKNSARRRSSRLSEVYEIQEQQQAQLEEDEIEEQPSTIKDGDYLIGKWINARLPKEENETEARERQCLVIGCQFRMDEEENRTYQMHQLYNMQDEEVVFADLGRELEDALRIVQVPKDHDWIGERIIVWWKGTYTNPKDQNEARQLFGKYKTKVPWEAWIVKKVDDNNFLIVYTVADAKKAIEKKKLTANDSDDDWMLVDITDTTAQALPIVSWSGNCCDLESVPKKKK